MSKPIKLMVDCSTGTTTEVELTDEEIAELEASALVAEEQRLAREAEAQAKAEAKASALVKLQTLGLTEDEAVALLG